MFLGGGMKPENQEETHVDLFISTDNKPELRIQPGTLRQHFISYLHLVEINSRKAITLDFPTFNYNKNGRFKQKVTR